MSDSGYSHRLKSLLRLIRFLGTFHGGLPYEFASGFMQSVDLEFKEFGVSKAVGLALQNSDFGVGSFQRSGRNAVVIVVEDAGSDLA